ncbi:MAG: polyprenyl synthetase family protein [Saprospiraceae bacterium]|nr:polyprenyl synthetase family protein [Saprospiraceae bacterium]
MTNLHPAAELLESFDRYRLEQFQNARPPLLYDPVVYMMNLGGKRIRPLATLWVARQLGGDPEAAMDAAYGVELFHNFTLMHDDIMDAAEMRRNQLCAHVRYGTSAAILSGDVMLIESIRYLREAERKSGTHGLCDVLIRTAREVCEGQAMDMEFEASREVGLEDYIEMIRRKTAVLLAACLELGARIGGCPDLAETCYSVGQWTGIGFQLEDDYLDFYAQDAAFGKLHGGDIRRKKKSGLILELCDRFLPEERKDFLKWYQEEASDEARIAGVGKAFEERNIAGIFRQRIDSYKQRAMQAVDTLDQEGGLSRELRAFVEWIFSRSY